MLSHSFTSSAILYNYYGLSYAHSPRELPVHPRPSLPSAVSFCFLMPPHNSSCVRPPWSVPSAGSITAACCSGTFKGARLGESSGVLVLADLGGCSFWRILKGARAAGFEGRWLWRILWGQKKWCLFCADLGGCSFWRILRSARLGSFQRPSLWRTSRGQRRKGEGEGRTGRRFSGSEVCFFP